MKILLSISIITLTINSSISQIVPIRIIEGPQAGVIVEIFFSPDGNEVVTGGFNPSVNRFEFISGDLISSIGFQSGVVDVSNNFELVAIAKGIPETHVYNLNSGELVHIFKGHDETFGSGRNRFPVTILDMEFSSNNNYLITSANDLKTILWDVDSEQELFTFKFSASPIIFSPDFLYVSLGGVFFSTKTFEESFNSINGAIRAAFSNNGNFFISGKTSTVEVWQWKNNTKIFDFTFSNIYDPTLSIDISKDDKYVITSTRSGFIHLIDLEINKIVSSFLVGTFYDNVFQETFSYLPVKFHPSGDFFAVRGPEGSVLIYNLQEVLASQSQVKEWKDYE